MPPASRRLLFPGFCLGLGKGPGSLSLPRDTHTDKVLPAWDVEREAGGGSCLCPLPQGLGTSHEPSWCPLVASSLCPPCLSHHRHFLLIPGSCSGPSCPRRVPSWHPALPAGSVRGQCHQLMPSLWTPPDANSHPQPTAPSSRELPAASPSQGCPSKNYVDFSDLWPSGTHHLAFHLHPKSRFNYTSGRDHFRELLFGAKC